MSGNIRLNTSPLILSGSSCGESFGVVSFLSEGTGSEGLTSLGSIATPLRHRGKTKSPVQYSTSCRTP
jgi:hypothetical protein